jgi:flagellar assembly protein FliH
MACKVLPPGAAVKSVDWFTPRSPSPVREEKPAPEPEPVPAAVIDIAGREQAAYERGVRDGEGTAAHDASARLDGVMARLARTISELATARTRALAQADGDIVQLSMAVARRILRRELTVDPHSLAGIVKAALERVAVREVHRVRIHPDDAPCLERQLRASGGSPDTEICPDPSLERGSVILETARGNLDASISVQLVEIERGLTDLLRRQPA